MWGGGLIIWLEAADGRGGRLKEDALGMCFLSPREPWGL